MPEPPEKREFQIALTMSGAISAGAYTAGVFDFLIEALDQWDKARRGEIEGVDPETLPLHRVGLKAMSGASAGAITAAVGAVALADAAQQPVYVDAAKTRVKCYLPKLYDTWVVRPTLMADGDASDFLRTTDIDRPVKPDDDLSITSEIEVDGQARPPLASLLNARLLDEIAKAALDVKAIGAPRPFIASTLHVYLTLTNLRGVPYRVNFVGGDYHMISHGDRAHYALTGLGGWDTPGSRSAFGEGDSGRALDAAGLRGDGKAGWRDFTVCALASAAFPVGLAPRHISTETAEYNGGEKDKARFRRFPNDSLATCEKIEPNWPDELKAAETYAFMTVDGGTIDNDPFEYARFALKKEGQFAERIDSNMTTADRAVIMISPFPEEKPIRAAGKPAADILSIVAALLPSLIDQARFKPSELVLAANPAYASRFLIGPRRVPEGSKRADTYAIASGLLGGFGGFVSRAYRDHDFQLGRRNCQRFLATIFALPAANGNFDASPQFLADPAPDGTPQYCIIPLVGTARRENVVELTPWPSITQKDFTRLQARIARRFDRVHAAFVADKFRDALLLRAGLALLQRPIRKKALAFVEAAILADLVRRNQIEGFADAPLAAGLDADGVRMVLAQMVTADPAPQSARTIAAALGATPSQAFSEAQVKAVLDRCQLAYGKPYQVWQANWVGDDDGAYLYALSGRRPGPATRSWMTLRGAIRGVRTLFTRRRAPGR